MATAFKRVLITLAALAAASTGLAQVKEGPVDLVLCFGGPTHTLAAAPGDRFGSYTVTGGTQSADPAFNALGMECTGIFEARAGGFQHKGYCVFQDAGGDKTYVADSTGAQGYVWQYVGGSGKFQGISGSGRMEVLGQMAPVRPGTMQGCRRVTGTYKMP